MIGWIHNLTSFGSFQVVIRNLNGENITNFVSDAENHSVTVISGLTFEGFFNVRRFKTLRKGIFSGGNYRYNLVMRLDRKCLHSVSPFGSVVAINEKKHDQL